MSSELLVGCPVRQRNWILPAWFKHVYAAAEHANTSVGFVFVVDPLEVETLDMLVELARGFPVTLIPFQEPFRPDERLWNEDRYVHLAALRNTLLSHVRRQNPRWFLSLDSDILLCETGILDLIETQEEKDWGAVGGKLYMTPTGTWCPSYATFSTQSGALVREESSGVFRCDVIMGCKLMTPVAYACDYEEHFQGEDIGICLNWKKAGVRIGWDGRSVNKHVMSTDMVDAVDPRVGF